MPPTAPARARPADRAGDRPSAAQALRPTTRAPWLRGMTISLRPGRSWSAATAAKAALIRENAVIESANAMTVEPAPDRQAPIAPASRAASTRNGSCGIDGRPVLLVDPVDGQRAQQVVASGRQAGHADRDPAEVGDRVRVGHRRRQGRPHLVGREAQLGDEQDGAQLARGVEAERLHGAVGVVVEAGGDGEAAQERGGRVVRVTLDARRRCAAGRRS